MNDKLIFESTLSGKKVTIKKPFITSFTDKFTSDWESEKVHGRMDAIQTFKSTTRVISFAVDIVAADAKSAKENMKKMSQLTSMLYPKYESGALNSSPLFRVKLGTWIQNSPTGKGLLGTISGFSFTPLMEGTFSKLGDPMQMRIECNLAVIHEHKLDTDSVNPYKKPKAKAGTVAQNPQSQQRAEPNSVAEAQQVAQNNRLTGSANA